MDPDVFSCVDSKSQVLSRKPLFGLSSRPCSLTELLLENHFSPGYWGLAQPLIGSRPWTLFG